MMVTNYSVTAKNSKNDDGPNTGLIAGLTTGLVCAALIALTAGLLIYRKRKRAQMIDIKRKPTSLENPTSPHTEIVMTEPTCSKFKVPPTSIPVPTVPTAPTALPAAAAPVATSTAAADHYQDQSRYISSPLFIPPLSATTSSINNKPTSTGTKATTIQRSLTLSARPQYDPSKTLAINNIASISSSNNNVLSSPLNRSSSVKVTKYDHNPPVLDDDDLDHVQIRRAISVKRRNAAAHSTYLANQPSATPILSVSRSTSLRSQKTNSRLLDDGTHSTKILPTTASSTTHDDEKPANNDDDDDDSLNEVTSTSSIQVVCAKPTIARIRSISRKNSAKKKTTKVVEQGHDQHQHATTTDSSNLTPPNQSKSSERMSMRSMPDSTHSSILADGEITVYWQPPSN